MAGRADIQAGRAFIRLFMKDDLTKQMSRALSKAGTQLRSFGQSVTSLGVQVFAAGGAMSAPFILAITFCISP